MAYPFHNLSQDLESFFNSHQSTNTTRPQAPPHYNAFGQGPHPHPFGGRGGAHFGRPSGRHTRFEDAPHRHHHHHSPDSSPERPSNLDDEEATLLNQLNAVRARKSALAAAEEARKVAKEAREKAEKAEREAKKAEEELAKYREREERHARKEKERAERHARREREEKERVEAEKLAAEKERVWEQHQQQRAAAAAQAQREQQAQQAREQQRAAQLEAQARVQANRSERSQAPSPFDFTTILNHPFAREAISQATRYAQAAEPQSGLGQVVNHPFARFAQQQLEAQQQLAQRREQAIAQQQQGREQAAAQARAHADAEATQRRRALEQQAALERTRLEQAYVARQQALAQAQAKKAEEIQRRRKEWADARAAYVQHHQQQRAAAVAAAAAEKKNEKEEEGGLEFLFKILNGLSFDDEETPSKPIAPAATPAPKPQTATPTETKEVKYETANGNVINTEHLAELGEVGDLIKAMFGIPSEEKKVEEKKAVVEEKKATAPAPTATPRGPFGFGYPTGNIICDNCDNKIDGTRFKCLNCPDYDLCATCQPVEGVHSKEHAFLELTPSASPCGPRGFGGRGRCGPRSAEQGTRHPFVVCDHCDKSIVGVRYKCTSCEDYDLCETCKPVEGVHAKDHSFEAIGTSRSGSPAKKEEVMAQQPTAQPQASSSKAPTPAASSSSATPTPRESNHLIQQLISQFLPGLSGIELDGLKGLGLGELIEGFAAEHARNETRPAATTSATRSPSEERTFTAQEKGKAKEVVQPEVVSKVPEVTGYEVPETIKYTGNFQRSTPATTTPESTPAPASTTTEESEELRAAVVKTHRLKKLSNLYARLYAVNEDWTFPETLDFSNPSSEPSSPSLYPVDSTSAPDEVEHIPALTFSHTNQSYHAHAHALLQLITLADGVESDGDEDVRKARKEFVKTVEGKLKEMEDARAGVWRKIQEENPAVVEAPVEEAVVATEEETATETATETVKEPATTVEVEQPVEEVVVPAAEEEVVEPITASEVVEEVAVEEAPAAPTEQVEEPAVEVDAEFVEEEATLVVEEAAPVEATPVVEETPTPVAEEEGSHFSDSDAESTVSLPESFEGEEKAEEKKAEKVDDFVLL